MLKEKLNEVSTFVLEDDQGINLLHLFVYRDESPNPFKSIIDGYGNFYIPYLEEDSAISKQRTWNCGKLLTVCSGRLDENEFRKRFDGWVELEPDVIQEQDVESAREQLATTSEAGIFIGEYCNQCSTGRDYVCTCDYVELLVIVRDMLNYGMPPIIKYEHGCENFVLACHSSNIYAADGSNSYIPRWTVVGTKFYHFHPEDYDGWVEIDCSSSGVEVNRRDTLTKEEIEGHARAQEDWDKVEGD